MIKIILLDADGVLINGGMFSKKLAKEHNIGLDKTLEFFLKELPEATVGNADLKEIIHPYLHKWGWKGTVEEFLTYWFTSEHNIDETLVEHVQQLRKKGIICCLATNQEKYRIEYMLKEMGFADKFDKIFVSCNMQVKKPDLNYFKKILNNFEDTKKEEVLFFDDSKANILSAREFGIHAELYTTYKNFQHTLSKYLE